jgi:hypothetical protein
MAHRSRCILLAGRGKIEEILLQLFKYELSIQGARNCAFCVFGYLRKLGSLHEQRQEAGSLTPGAVHVDCLALFVFNAIGDVVAEKLLVDPHRYR